MSRKFAVTVGVPHREEDPVAVISGPEVPVLDHVEQFKMFRASGRVNADFSAIVLVRSDGSRKRLRFISPAEMKRREQAQKEQERLAEVARKAREGDEKAQEELERYEAKRRGKEKPEDGEKGEKNFDSARKARAKR